MVDGFRAVERLREENREWFDVLSRYCARFEYAGQSGVVLRSRRPMIELSPDGELIAVRFNNRSAAATIDVPYDDMETFYTAYRRFGEIVDDPQMRVEFRLSRGSASWSTTPACCTGAEPTPGTGRRWLQGCYADKDGLLSKLAVLQAQDLESAQ